MSLQLPSLNALRAFEAAARLNSVRAAGDELNVTHGAISRQVKSLEQSLGTTLFVKHGRGIKLTDQGQRLLSACSSSFAQLSQACHAIRQDNADRPFVLGCSASLLARWFIPRLDQLQRDLPNLNLQLSSSQGEPDPSNLHVDATLVFAEAPWPLGLEVLPIRQERIGAVTSASYVERKGLSQDVQTLFQAEILATHSRPQAWPLWCAAKGIAGLEISQHFEHLYFLLEAAAAGLGVAIAPQDLVSDDINAGRLLAPWGFVETAGVLALCVNRPDPRAYLLANWLREQFGEK